MRLSSSLLGCKCFNKFCLFFICETVAHSFVSFYLARFIGVKMIASGFHLCDFSALCHLESFGKRFNCFLFAHTAIVYT